MNSNKDPKVKQRVEMTVTKKNQFQDMQGNEVNFSNSKTFDKNTNGGKDKQRMSAISKDNKGYHEKKQLCRSCHYQENDISINSVRHSLHCLPSIYKNVDKTRKEFIVWSHLRENIFSQCHMEDCKQFYDKLKNRLIQEQTALKPGIKPPTNIVMSSLSDQLLFAEIFHLIKDQVSLVAIDAIQRNLHLFIHHVKCKHNGIPSNKCHLPPLSGDEACTLHPCGKYKLLGQPVLESEDKIDHQCSSSFPSFASDSKKTKSDSFGTKNPVVVKQLVINGYVFSLVCPIGDKVYVPVEDAVLSFPEIKNETKTLCKNYIEGKCADFQFIRCEHVESNNQGFLKWFNLRRAELKSSALKDERSKLITSSSILILWKDFERLQEQFKTCCVFSDLSKIEKKETPRRKYSSRRKSLKKCSFKKRFESNRRRTPHQHVKQRTLSHQNICYIPLGKKYTLLKDQKLSNSFAKNDTHTASTNQNSSRNMDKKDNPFSGELHFDEVNKSSGECLNVCYQKRKISPTNKTNLKAKKLSSVRTKWPKPVWNKDDLLSPTKKSCNIPNQESQNEKDKQLLVDGNFEKAQIFGRTKSQRDRIFHPRSKSHRHHMQKKRKRSKRKFEKKTDLLKRTIPVRRSFRRSCLSSEEIEKIELEAAIKRSLETAGDTRSFQKTSTTVGNEKHRKLENPDKYERSPTSISLVKKKNVWTIPKVRFDLKRAIDAQKEKDNDDFCDLPDIDDVDSTSIQPYLGKAWEDFEKNLKRQKGETNIQNKVVLDDTKVPSTDVKLCHLNVSKDNNNNNISVTVKDKIPKVAETDTSKHCTGTPSITKEIKPTEKNDFSVRIKEIGNNGELIEVKDAEKDFKIHKKAPKIKPKIVDEVFQVDVDPEGMGKEDATNVFKTRQVLPPKMTPKEDFAQFTRIKDGQEITEGHIKAEKSIMHEKTTNIAKDMKDDSVALANNSQELEKEQFLDNPERVLCSTGDINFPLHDQKVKDTKRNFENRNKHNTSNFPLKKMILQREYENNRNTEKNHVREDQLDPKHTIGKEKFISTGQSTDRNEYIPCQNLLREVTSQLVSTVLPIYKLKSKVPACSRDVMDWINCKPKKYWCIRDQENDFTQNLGSKPDVSDTQVHVFRNNEIVNQLCEYQYKHHKKHLLAKFYGLEENHGNVFDFKLPYDSGILLKKYIRIGRYPDLKEQSKVHVTSSKTSLIGQGSEESIKSDDFLEFGSTDYDKNYSSSRFLQNRATSGGERDNRKEWERDSEYVQPCERTRRAGKSMFGLQYKGYLRCDSRDGSDNYTDVSSEQSRILWEGPSEMDENVTITRISSACGAEYWTSSCYDIETKLSLSGYVNYQGNVFPYIIRNGIKFSPIKDLRLLFSGCNKKCYIWRSVLTKQKSLMPTMCNFDEVNLFNQIFKTQDTRITSGSLMVHVDKFMDNINDIMEEIAYRHCQSTSKTSQKCTYNFKSP